jgi:rhodanese-related sulfurtransferase
MPRISVEELKALMDSGTRIAILDVRPKESFDLGHIAGAISFPWKSQLTMGDVELLPMTMPMVTYCDCGPGEADSADVAFQLLGFGITDVEILAHPAIEGWLEAGYPSQ